MTQNGCLDTLNLFFFHLIGGLLVSNNHLLPFWGHFSGFFILKGVYIGAAHSVKLARQLNFYVQFSMCPESKWNDYEIDA